MHPLYEEVSEVAGYRLTERIGSGGMGEVYKAYNSSLNRWAAVKILFEATHAERFKNEAYIQSSVNHPNIARLYEYATCGDRHCIVMEYVEGESLDSILHRKRKFSNEETEEILRQVISALAYLHKKDIIHRDIKPQNFKMQADGLVKMLDFGIAKHKYSPKFTQAGFVVGTTEYLAPEQFQQQSELKSDVWALGVMAYELLTGYMPFEAPNLVALQVKIKKGIYTNPKVLVPLLSEKLAILIDKCLRVNTAMRSSSAGIEALLGRRERNLTGLFTFIPPAAKRFVVPAAAGIVLVVILLLFTNGDEVPDPAIQVNEKIKLPAAEKTTNKIIINVPGISNAELILQDGVRQPLPFTVSGKEGDKFEFTIRAAGYKDKAVQVVITPRRISYEFNLDKN